MSDRPTCGACQKVMTPENSQITPELFLCDDCALKVQRHFDCTPGLTMDGATVEEVSNHGNPCFKATAQIGTIFGSPVEGEISAIGRTREEALERLAEERRKLHESLFA